MGERRKQRRERKGKEIWNVGATRRKENSSERSSGTASDQMRGMQEKAVQGHGGAEGLYSRGDCNEKDASNGAKAAAPASDAAMQRGQMCSARAPEMPQQCSCNLVPCSVDVGAPREVFPRWISASWLAQFCVPTWPSSAVQLSIPRCSIIPVDGGCGPQECCMAPSRSATLALRSLTCSVRCVTRYCRSASPRGFRGRVFYFYTMDVACIDLAAPSCS